MTVLITTIWQGLVVAGATALMLKGIPRASAAAKHTMWWVALAIVLALPLWSVVVDRGAAVATERVAPAVIARAAEPGTTVLSVPAPPAWLSAGLTAVCLGWCGFAAARLVAGLVALRRLKRGSSQLDEAVQRQLTLWQAARGGRRRPVLHRSSQVSTACVAGLFGRPMIIVSDRLVDALRPSDLDHIVMHEHAHLARYDDWLQLLQSGVEAIAGLHPAVAFIGRRIEAEREAACDDRVVMQTGAAWLYARSLANAADVAGATPRHFAGALALGATRSGRVLVARVARLVDRESRDGRHQTRLTSLLCGLSAPAAACLAVVAMPQIVVERPTSGWPSVEAARAFEAQATDLFPIAVIEATSDERSNSTAPRQGTAGRAPSAPAAGRPQPRPTVDNSQEGGSRHATSGGSPVAPRSVIASVSPASVSASASASALESAELGAAAVLPSRSLAVTAGKMPDLAGDRSMPLAFDHVPRPTRVEGLQTAWSAAGERTAAFARDIARASASSGSTARGASVAVARFFGRARTIARTIVADHISTDP